MSKKQSKKQVKKENFFKKNINAVILFAISLFTLLYKIIFTQFENADQFISYIFSYSLGFKHNLFFSTLERLFFFKITYGEIKAYSVITIIAMSLLIAFFFAKAVEIIGEENRDASLILFGLFTLMVITMSNFTGINPFMVLLLILTVICIKTDSAKIFVPILSVISVLSNKDFIFETFIPLAIILMFEIVNSESKSKKLYKNLLVSSTAISAVGFAYFEFAESKIPAERMEEILANWLIKCNAVVDKEAFKIEYVLSPIERIKALIVTDYKVRIIEIFGSLLPVLFLIFFAYIIWLKTIRSNRELKEKSLGIISMIYPIIAIIVSFFVNVNLSAIVVSILCTLYIPIVYFITCGKTEFSDSAIKFMKDNLLIIILFTVLSFSATYFASKVVDNVINGFIETWWMPF